MNFLTTQLDKIPGLKHGFFNRLGGVSTGVYESLNCGWKTEDKDNFLTNRERVANALGFPREKMVVAKQIHGNKVVNVTKPWTFSDYASGGIPECDGMVTAIPGIALCILTADCAPILFADKNKKIIGACHAGWRGAVGGVIEATIEAMIALGADVNNIETALGPCIGPQSYEVSDDFPAPFLAQDPLNIQFFREGKRAGRLMFDIPAYVTHRLTLAGIKTIYDTKQDTCAIDTFFSNRRALLKDENGFGVQASVIGMEA